MFGHPNAAVLTYYGLLRSSIAGRECGNSHKQRSGRELSDPIDMGLVSQVFGQEELARLKGTRAIGHTPLLDDRHEHDQERATLCG